MEINPLCIVFPFNYKDIFSGEKAQKKKRRKNDKENVYESSATVSLNQFTYF